MSTFKIPAPTGTDWTLLFKFHKTTVILPVEATDSFSEIRSKLYTALKSTPNLTNINGADLPNSAESIELAAPIEAGDLYSGWQSIDIDGDNEGQGSKGKGAAPKNNPKGLGLKDGATLAFRFGDAVEEDDWPVKIPTFDERDEALANQANGG